MGNGALLSEKSFKHRLASSTGGTSSTPTSPKNNLQIQNTSPAHENFDDTCYEAFKKALLAYDENFRPLIRMGQMTEKEAFLATKSKYEELLNLELGKRDVAFTRSNQSEFFEVGDVVRVNDKTITREGVVIELIGAHNVKLDFGEFVSVFAAANCVLVMRGEEFEVGDQVEVQLPNTALYCLGEIISIHPDTTLDIRMAGDDPDDIERHVKRPQCRKIMTKRSLARDRWRRISWTIIASNKFLKQIQWKERSPEEIGDEEEEFNAFQQALIYSDSQELQITTT